MKRRRFLSLGLLGFSGCTSSGLHAALGDELEPWRDSHLEAVRACERFAKTYPGVIQNFSAGERGEIRATLRNGSEIVVEDFVENRSFEQRLESPDLLDMISEAYPAALPANPWPENFDPGRYRCDDFLKATYGASEDEVRGNLKVVSLGGHDVLFNQRNGAAAALERVAEKLDALFGDLPELEPYLQALGGGFSWRKIAGTERMSGHSYGMAIDLNPKLGGYWRWELKADPSDMERRRQYPEAIVRAFESEKFIWGGKWYHFDLMHFEFRPEFFG